MADIATLNPSTNDAIDQLIIDSGRMHRVINGGAYDYVTVEDGSLIPSLRKALLDNLYYKTPAIEWLEGATTQVFNQLFAYENPTSGTITWWYAPSATVDNPVVLTESPFYDSNWRVLLDSATIEDKYAVIDSPAFTGLPTAPTPPVEDVSTSLATTEFVDSVIKGILAVLKVDLLEAKNADVEEILSAKNVQVSDTLEAQKISVKDIVVTGDVEGIATTVTGLDITPKSVKTTNDISVGGELKLSGTKITLGDGTLIDLTNIPSSSEILASVNLNRETGNKNFVWDASTLNTPVVGSSGKGMVISKNSSNATQVGFIESERAFWVRYLTSGVWGAWTSLLATNAETITGVSSSSAISPQGATALLSHYGIGSGSLTAVTNLNTLASGQLFFYQSGAENSPTSSLSGRGVCISSTGGGVTVLVIEEESNKLFTRHLTQGSWSAWIETKGDKGDTGDQGDRGVPGVSAYDTYVSTLAEGETPLSEADWIASLRGSDWLSGDTVPSVGIGRNKDYYLLLTAGEGNGDVYSKTAGAWSRKGSILGPQGPAAPETLSAMSTNLPLATSMMYSVENVERVDVGDIFSVPLAGSETPVEGVMYQLHGVIPVSCLADGVSEFSISLSHSEGIVEMLQCKVSSVGTEEYTFSPGTFVPCTNGGKKESIIVLDGNISFSGNLTEGHVCMLVDNTGDQGVDFPRGGSISLVPVV